MTDDRKINTIPDESVERHSIPYGSLKPNAPPPPPEKTPAPAVPIDSSPPKESE
jgi:hypothetical protein